MVAQTPLNKIDGKIGDVNPDPASPQPFRHSNGRAAAAKRVEDDIAFVAARFNDSLQ